MSFSNSLNSNNYIVHSVVLIIMFLSSLHADAQEKFLLIENEIPGYHIIFQEAYNDSSISQTWEPIDDGNNISINYYEHNNEENTIAGLPYSVGYFAGIYYYGSNAGEIIGNASWSSGANQFGSEALYFQKWNAVVHIHLGIYNPKFLLEISNKILNKIDENVSQDYFAKDEELKKYQISLEEYDQLTEGCLSLFSEKNYTVYRTEDTKWELTKDSLVLGLRKQWSADNTNFSIDIVRLSNSEDAQAAGVNKDSLTWSPKCQLDVQESIEQAIERINPSKNFISVTGVLDNYAIHFYYHHEEQVDVDFFKSILFSFDNSTGLVSNDLKDIKVYPNPAKNIVLIESNCEQYKNYTLKIFNSYGQQTICKDIVLSGVLQIDVSKLKKGIYLFKIENNKRQIAKLILVE